MVEVVGVVVEVVDVVVGGKVVDVVVDVVDVVVGGKVVLALFVKFKVN